MDVTGAPVLRAAGLRVELGGRPVLEGVDVAIRAGEAVALLGPNGSGKTTLIRAFVGLQAPAAGVVEVFGRPAGDRSARSRIGYVPQRTTATTGVPATVREVVASGRVRRQRRLHRAGRDDRAAVDAALDAVRLRGRARDPVSALSGGQQQRVLVARALAAEPEVLVLDEPTSAADAATEVAIAGTLQALRERGVTLVIVTHHLGPLASVVDRAVTLEAGRVVGDGPVLADAPHGADHHDVPPPPPPSPTGLQGAV